MATLSPPIQSNQMTRLVAEVPCEWCGSPERVVMRLARVSPNKRPKKVLDICDMCMADALEKLTGFGFVAQMIRWYNMRTLTRKPRRGEEGK